DDERVARDAAVVEPAAEELLGAAVAARDVDVADAGGERRVQQLRRPPRELVGRARVAEIGGAAEVDVARAPDGRQAEPETRYDEAGPAELASGNACRHRARYGASGRRSHAAVRARSTGRLAAPRRAPWYSRRMSRRPRDRDAADARTGGGGETDPDAGVWRGQKVARRFVSP